MKTELQRKINSAVNRLQELQRRSTSLAGWITYMVVFSATSAGLQAQDPVLPPTNLGLANVFDGIAPKPPVLLYVNYTQLYQTKQIRDFNGDNTHSDLKINSILSMNQFIYLTKVKALGGHLGFTVLIPLVKITATNNTGAAPNVNPAVLGDLIQGTAIQWSEKKLFNKTLSHRAEIDISFPVGAYDKQYKINPSAHEFSVGMYHAFTMILSENMTMSSRNQFNYNFKMIDSNDKPGAFYNGNYSVDFALGKKFKAEVVAYYLAQINRDTYAGDKNYYSNQFGITNTKEHVLGVGPGLVYLTPIGALIEAKVFFEAAAQNRTEGLRSVLRLAIPL